MKQVVDKESMNILIIEDQDSYLRHLKSFITKRNKRENVCANIFSAKTSHEAKKILKEREFDLAFFDLDLNGKIEGFELLEKYRNRVKYPVILTAFDDQDLADKGYRLGSKDYLIKPFSFDSINFLFAKFENYSRIGNFESHIKDRFFTNDHETISELLQMKEARINKRPIHISGPTGVGKQICAELIFELVQKSKSHFIERNCAGFNNSLLSSELFGHTKGSFTGAISDKKGIFEIIKGGTLFLDEIDKMSIQVQDRLLKVIEQKKFSKLGDEKNLIQTDFFLITAASRDLDELVEKGEFRADLKERLNGIHINLRGLSERREDIEFQLKRFIEIHESNRRVGFSKEARSFLINDYDWPGNSRELSAFVDHIQAKQSNSLLTLENLNFMRNKFLKRKVSSISKAAIDSIKKSEHSLISAIQKIESEVINYFYELNNSNSTKTIKQLGIGTRKFYQYVSKNRKDRL